MLVVIIIITIRRIAVLLIMNHYKSSGSEGDWLKGSVAFVHCSTAGSSPRSVCKVMHVEIRTCSASFCKSVVPVVGVLINSLLLGSLLGPLISGNFHILQKTEAALLPTLTL